MQAMPALKKYPEEMRERAARLVRDKLADTPGPGTTSDDAARIAALERENRELRRANTILRQASAYFAQVELARL
jgi:transposase